MVDVEPVDVRDRRGAHADGHRPRRMIGAGARAGRAGGSWNRARRGCGGVGGHDHRRRDDGAAGGATPTSSTPTTRVAPSRQSGRSKRRVGTITVIGAMVPRAWQTRRHATPVRPGRRLHYRSRARQPARGRPRRHGARHGDAAVRPMDEPVGDHVRAPAGGPGADYRVRISRPTPSWRSPGTRRWAPAMRGSRRAAGPGPGRIAQSCGAGLVAIRRAGGLPRVRCASPAPVRARGRGGSHVVTASIGLTGRPSSMPSGATTAPAGSSCCSRAPRPSSRSSPAP